MVQTLPSQKDWDPIQSANGVGAPAPLLDLPPSPTILPASPHHPPHLTLCSSVDQRQPLMVFNALTIRAVPWLYTDFRPVFFLNTFFVELLDFKFRFVLSDHCCNSPRWTLNSYFKYF